jgi:tRNA (mo5U34)-methyltransferase
VAAVTRQRPTDEVLAREWFYEFDLPDGRRTTPYVPAEVASLHTARLSMAFAAIERTFGSDWARLSFLDLGCHQGWFASHVARRGAADVLAVDIRTEHLDDAALIRDLYGLDRLRFEQHDVPALQRGALGQFDVVLMLGLLYHVENPVGLLRTACSHTSRLCLVETQLAPNVSGWIDWGSHRWVKPLMGSFGVIDEGDELSNRNPEANTSAISLLPSLEALVFVMRAVGFDHVELLPPDCSNEQLESGKRAMVAGWIGSAP